MPGPEPYLYFGPTQPSPPPLLLLTASFRLFPGLNLAWVDADICIGSPVRGLRPDDAGLFAVVKVPKPTSRTSPPRRSSSEMESKIASTALAASALLSPLALATAPMRSCLFTDHPPGVLPEQHFASSSLPCQNQLEIRKTSPGSGGALGSGWKARQEQDGWLGCRSRARMAAKPTVLAILPSHDAPPSPPNLMPPPTVPNHETPRGGR